MRTTGSQLARIARTDDRLDGRGGGYVSSGGWNFRFRDCDRVYWACELRLRLRLGDDGDEH